MGHAHHTSMATDPWMIGVIALVIIAAIIGLIWLVHRGTVASDGLTPVERGSLQFQEREILSMLRQHGGPLAQSEIADLLPGDTEEIGEVMNEMETKGLIRREWKPEQSTYLVSTIS